MNLHCFFSAALTDSIFFIVIVRDRGIINNKSSYLHLKHLKCEDVIKCINLLCMVLH